jgi:hypothetical protein
MIDRTLGELRSEALASRDGEFEVTATERIALIVENEMMGFSDSAMSKFLRDHPDIATVEMFCGRDILVRARACVSVDSEEAQELVVG